MVVGGRLGRTRAATFGSGRGRRDRRRRARSDPRGGRRPRRGDPTGHHLPRHPQRAEAAELEAATGLRGWALGPLPAAFWVERHEPAIAAATKWYLTTWEWLAYRLTGEAAAPGVPHQAVPDASVVAAATGLPMDRRPAASAMGAVVGRLTETAADALGLAAGIPVVVGPSMRSRATLAPGSSSPATPTTRRLGRRLRGLPGPAGRGPGRLRDAGAAQGLYSVGAAMAATGRAVDWFRTPLWGRG